MSISTGQGPDLDEGYMKLLQFLSTGMKDREAVQVIYLLQPFIEKVEDNDMLVALIEELR